MISREFQEELTHHAEEDVIDAFRPINPGFLLLGKEHKQTTSDQSSQSTAYPGFGLPTEQTSLLYPDQLPQNVPQEKSHEPAHIVCFTLSLKSIKIQLRYHYRPLQRIHKIFGIAQFVF